MSLTGTIEREEALPTTPDGWTPTRTRGLADGPTRSALDYLAAMPRGERHIFPSQQTNRS